MPNFSVIQADVSSQGSKITTLHWQATLDVSPPVDEQDSVRVYGTAAPRIEATYQASMSQADLVDLLPPSVVAQASFSLAKQVDALKNPVQTSETPADITPVSRSGEWQQSATYKEGDQVLRGGKLYQAMPDVAKGIAPDDVFDADANTGGWKPVGI